MSVVELAIAGLLALGGIRSGIHWVRIEFAATSMSERLLYTLHLTARVGLWFAFAGLFLGYAVVDEPQRFGWYILVPIALAGAQLLTGMLLARSEAPGSGRGE